MIKIKFKSNRLLFFANDFVRYHRTMRGQANIRQLEKLTGLSRPTLYKLLDPQGYENQFLQTLAVFVFDGLGIPPSKLNDLKFSDLFEIEGADQQEFVANRIIENNVKSAWGPESG